MVGAAGLLSAAVAAAHTRLGGVLRYCGERSIVIYLAFFLPMAATRILLVKSGLAGGAIDVGTASLMVTACAVVTPLILRQLIGEGALRWLFERPAWARLADRPAGAEPLRHPA